MTVDSNEVSEYDRLDSIINDISSSDVIKDEVISDFLLLASKLKRDLSDEFFSVKRDFNCFYREYSSEVICTMKRKDNYVYLCNISENLDNIGIRLFNQLVVLCDKHFCVIEDLDFLRKKLLVNLNNSYEANFTSLSDKLVSDLKPLLDKCIEVVDLTDELVNLNLNETDIKIPMLVKERQVGGNIVDKTIDVDYSLLTGLYNHLKDDVKFMLDNSHFVSGTPSDECVTKYSFHLRKALGNLYDVIIMNNKLYKLVIDFKKVYNSVSEKSIELISSIC